MIPTSVIQMSDLSRQKRFRAELPEDLTPDHTVDQAVELYLDRMGIPDHGLPWSAFSRGVRLDRNDLVYMDVLTAVIRLPVNYAP